MVLRHETAHWGAQPAHRAVVTAANVHDKHPLADLLHGNEQRVYGDSAYASQKALPPRRPKPGTSPTSGCARAAKSTRLSTQRTATSPRCVRAWSMSLRWSSGCGASTRCATKGWPRTPHARSWPLVGQHLLGAQASDGVSAPAVGATRLGRREVGPTRGKSMPARHRNLAMGSSTRARPTEQDKSVACSALP